MGGIVSDASTSTTTKTACKTAAGYYITSSADAADAAIRVAQVPAGKYLAGGTALVTSNAADKGTGAETPTNCAAGKSSVAGSDAVGDCTNCAAGKSSSASGTCTDCAAGRDSAAGDAFCGKIKANYYGTATDGSSAHATVTACTATFTNGGSTAGIVSDASTSTTTKTACKTAAGYYIT